jgi:hypothetical protein
MFCGVNSAMGDTPWCKSAHISPAHNFGINNFPASSSGKSLTEKKYRPLCEPRRKLRPRHSASYGWSSFENSCPGANRNGKRSMYPLCSSMALLLSIDSIHPTCRGMTCRAALCPVTVRAVVMATAFHNCLTPIGLSNNFLSLPTP